MGLVATYGGDPEVYLVDADGQRVAAAVKTTPRPDAEESFRKEGMEGPKVIQFVLSADCPPSRCHLKVQTPDGDAASSPVITLGQRWEIRQNHIWVYIHGVNTFVSASASSTAEERDRKIQSLMRPLAVAYAYAMPFLVPVAMVSIALCCCSRQRIRKHGALLALVGACAVACLTRVVVIAYIDATLWPAVTTYYLSAAAPFLILLVVVGLYLGYLTLRNMWSLWLSRVRVAEPSR
jgi:hypothetical protein